MKKLLLLGAAAATAFAVPAATIAATSGTLRGEFTVPYACDITVPATQTLVVSGLDATLTGAAITLSQNGDTEYAVTTLSITEPAAASTSGLITVNRADSSVLVQADGSGSPTDDSNTIAGIILENGTVDFSQTETVAPNFAQGSYAIQTTLSCSESGGGGGGGF
jgi:hypothetical protein